MRPRIYDHAKVKRLYRQGYSLPEIRKRLGISLAQAWAVVGRTRTVSQAKLLRSKGWRKLVPMKKASTRILSLPSEMIKAVGFSPRAKLEGKWIVIGRHKLCLKIRKTSRRTKRGVKQEWKYLYKMDSGSTRILSLPISVLREAGCSPNRNWLGKWVVQGTNLILRLKEA